MKRKNTIKIIIFILLLGLLFGVVSHVLTAVDKSGFQNIHGLYEEPADSLDAVYIGSSNCFEYWNPLLAWKEYGITVYPYCCNATQFYATEFLIKEARKTQPDAVYIVNINSLTNGKISISRMRTIIDCMPFSENKLEMIDYLADIGDYSFNDRIEFYVPIIRYHTRWSQLTPGDFYMKVNGLKGASTYDRHFDTSTDISEDYVTSEGEVELVDKIVDSTNRLLDYCDKENLKVLFVTVPQARGKEYDAERYNALNRLIESRGYDVLNLLDKNEETGIDATKDFYNHHHTNIHGSVKYTYYLSEYLLEYYGFDDKRGDKAYASWDEAYENYTDLIAPYTLDFELTPHNRAFELTEPVVQAKAEGDYALLSWEPVKNADGYLIYKKVKKTGDWEMAGETEDTAFRDTMKKEGNHFYTVVPFLQKETRYYGDFNYKGVKLAH